MIFSTAAISKPGGRQNNEDDFGTVSWGDTYCWVIADGLGGHGGGEIAARLVVNQVLRCFEVNPQLSPDVLRRYLDIAQNTILQRQQEEPRLFRMRTTVVVLLADAQSAIWAHAGDSRLYHFRDGRIISQTKDHSIPQAMADAGTIEPGQIRYHEDRNRLLRSLGNKEDFRPTATPEPCSLKPGDAFLLCTDGFWEYVTETEMVAEFAKSIHPQAWLERMEVKLLQRAHGEHDNYSAIAVFVDREETASIRRPKSASVSHRPEKKQSRWLWLAGGAIACILLVLLTLFIWNHADRFRDQIQRLIDQVKGDQPEKAHVKQKSKLTQDFPSLTNVGSLILVLPRDNSVQKEELICRPYTT